MNDESRYAALIKPIRDLAQNWDVDIAHTLEDYLDELDDIRLPVANQGNLNFAEAALLIQGSTSVYSRKVEHLHNLVFQALELISSNREGKEKSTTCGSGAQHEEDSFSWGDDPSFLVLDDMVISSGVNIDIPQADARFDGTNRKNRTSRLSIASDVSRSSRASITLMNSIMMDGPSNSSGGAGSTSMKISSCSINADGALVFASLTSQNNRPGDRDSCGRTLDGSREGDVFHLADRSGPENEVWPEGGFNDEGFDYVQDDDHDDDHVEVYGESMDNGIHSEGTPVNSAEALDPSRRDASVSAIVAHNPLALLDPYDRSSASASRDVKKNTRTFKLPAALSKKGAQASTRKDMARARHSEALKRAKDVTRFSSNLWDTKISSQSSKALLTVDPQFASILKRRKKLGIFLATSADVAVASRGVGAVGGHAVGEDDWMGAVGDGDDDVSDYDMEEDDHEDGMIGTDFGYDGMDGEGEDAALTEEQVLARRVEGALQDAGFSHDNDSFVGNSSSSQSGLNYTNTFENLCRQHIKNFMRGAEDYARETNLSKRVSEWTGRLEPLLLEQEQRPEFDIHVYSDKALDKVAHRSQEIVDRCQKGEKLEEDESHVHFSDVVKGESSFEVGRMFLACLQLANLGNLTFSQTKDSISDFEVGLLSDSSNRLQIGSYRAPSLDA